MAAGGTKDDVCHVAYGYGLFTGGAGLHGGSHRVGCMTPVSYTHLEDAILVDSSDMSIPQVIDTIISEFKKIK